jgi:hypothetical protein
MARLMQAAARGAKQVRASVLGRYGARRLHRLLLVSWPSPSGHHRFAIAGGFAKA